VHALLAAFPAAIRTADAGLAAVAAADQLAWGSLETAATPNPQLHPDPHHHQAHRGG
jgi:hypothetical protein